MRRFLRLCGIVLCASGFVASASVRAADIGWNGSFSSSWQTDLNWNAFFVPDPPHFEQRVPIDGDTATLSDTSNGSTVSIAADTDFIDGLTVENGFDLETNGHLLIVDGGGALTTIRGDASRIIVTELAANPDSRSFDSDRLLIEALSGLEMQGGIAEIDLAAQIDSLGVLKGYGMVRFGVPSTPSGTTVLDNNGGVIVTRQATSETTLRIEARGGGMLDLDGASEFGALVVDDAHMDSHLTLEVDGPLADDFSGTLTIGRDDTAHFVQPWTANSAHIAFNPNGRSATLSGATAVLYSTEMSVLPGGTAVIESDITYHSGTIDVDATLRLDGRAAFSAVAELDLDDADALVINGTTDIYQPRINLDAFDDRLEVTIGAGGRLSLHDTELDGAGNRFFGTLNINSGTLHADIPGGWYNGGVTNLNGASGPVRLEGTEVEFTKSYAGAGLYVTDGVAEITADTVFGTSALVDVADGADLRLLGNTTTIDGGIWTGNGIVRLDANTTTVTGPTTMEGDIVDLDGIAIGADTLILNDVLTLKVDSIDASPGQRFDGDTIHVNESGRLNVALTDPDAQWIMDGVLELESTSLFFMPQLSGSDVELAGLVTVNSHTEWTARVEVTGHVDIADGSVRLSGGDLDDPNRIEGGTIDGPGRLTGFGPVALVGHGTINADIEFHESGPLQANLLAAGGILTVGGEIDDVSVLGTADETGVLEFTAPWNTDVASVVRLNGGKLTGAAITNGRQIEGSGLISAADLDNRGTIVALDGGTLVLDPPPGVTYDIDGLTNIGRIYALGATLEIRQNSVLLRGGFANVSLGGELFVDGSLSLVTLGPGPGSLVIDDGTVRTTGSFGQYGYLAATGPAHIEAEAGITFGPLSTNELLSADLRLTGDSVVDSAASFTGSGRLINTAGSTMEVEDTANLDVALRNEGRLVLGNSPGRIDVDYFEQAATGELEIQLGGLAESEFDRLNVDDEAHLAGVLEVTLIDLGGGVFDPPPGSSFKVLTAAGGRIGMFDELLLPALAGGLFFDVYYGDDTVTVAVAGVFGDYNHNGVVDAADYTVWRDLLGQTGAGLAADGDGNGVVDNLDYGVWKTNFGQTAAAGSAGVSPFQAAVPEPASCVLLVIAGLCRGLGAPRRLMKSRGGTQSR